MSAKDPAYHDREQVQKKAEPDAFIALVRVCGGASGFVVRRGTAFHDYAQPIPHKIKVGDFMIERERTQRSSVDSRDRPGFMALLVDILPESTNKQMNAPFGRIPIVATALIMRWLGPEQNCLPKFRSVMKRRF